MTPALTLPPLPIREGIQTTDASARELGELEQLLRKEDASLSNLEEQYDRICRFADEQGNSVEVHEWIRTIWNYACDSMMLDQRQLAKYRQLPRSRYNDVFIAGVTRHAERLAELMRTMAVVWEELELETPDEIFEAVWTICISPTAYLRAMWNLFWSAIRHPLSETTIDLSTGWVLYRN
jgi:hypothetical protein